MSKKSLLDLIHALGYENIPLWVQWLISLSDILIIVVLAWVVRYLIGRLIKVTHTRMAERERSADQRRRIQTLGRVFQYIANLVIGALVVMLVLSALGISIAPILATAGVVGLAVGFGTQSLVKDYFTGFVLLVENQIRVGDVVELCGKPGTVESVTLRYIRLRDYDGIVYFIPNGAITTVTNHSRIFAYAVLNIGVAYKEDIGRVYDLMRQTAQDMRTDSELKPLILEDIEISGVEEWAESEVVIKARIKTVALQQWKVRREYLYRLKICFDQHGVEIPFPHRMVYTIPSDKS